MDESDSDEIENMEVALGVANEPRIELVTVGHPQSPLSEDNPQSLHTEDYPPSSLSEDHPLSPMGDNEEEEHFDITLAASHSYLGEDLVSVRGRSEVIGGSELEIPLCPHHGVVFPGETVPMLLPSSQDLVLLDAAMHSDQLFGLLCPNSQGTTMSEYGVVCEVREAAREAAGGAALKARAVARCRRRAGAGGGGGAAGGAGGRGVCAVRVLHDYPLRAPQPRRSHRSLRRLDAAVTPWPSFVYDIFDYQRLRDNIKKYFKTLSLEHSLPSEPISLSFWVASNLALSIRDRLALFTVDDALLRLYMELQMIDKKSILCCVSCAAEVMRREDIFAMSSDGVHSNYTNLGGFMHDLVTVSRAVVSLSGVRSSEYSWFPGYTWTIALCAGCGAHLGWRFDAERRSLRPQQFFGICRNQIQPREDDLTDSTIDEL